MKKPNPKDFENDGAPEPGKAPHYRPFTEYTNTCRCGMCFHRITWVEEGPDEHARASDIGSLLYALLSTPPPKGLGSE